MLLTFTPKPVPYNQAFDAIKAAIDAMPAGVKLFINSGTSAVYLQTVLIPLQENFTDMTAPRPTWTCSLHSTRSTLNTRTRPSCL
jgi:hypothetical protein